MLGKTAEENYFHPLFCLYCKRQGAAIVGHGVLNYVVQIQQGNSDIFSNITVKIKWYALQK